jgi:hypothetical protein
MPPRRFTPEQEEPSMKKMLMSAVVLCALGTVGCGDDTGNGPDQTGPKYNTAEKLATFFEGKTMVMQGDNIPSHPNGFSEDLDLGSVSQCYNKVTLSVAGGNYNAVSIRGTLRDTATSGVKDCDHATAAGEAGNFTSTAVLIENVKEDGSCFDVTYTYLGFKQEGRGVVSQDGKTVKLELFFEGRATGHRCAAGNVGAQTVTHNGTAFTGNAVQTYTVQ